MSTSAERLWPLHERELRPALRVIVSLARADMGVLLLHDESARALFPVLAQGITLSQCEMFGPVREGSDPFVTAMTERRLVRVRNAWSDQTAMHDAARRLGFRHLEILPFFRDDGGALGAFAILYRARNGPPRHSARLTRDAAELFAVALSHAREQLRAESEREQLTRAAQQRVQFVAKMSHELRTPLQSIAGYINLLQTGTTDGFSEDQHRMLTRIAVSEQLLVHIIDDLISFSRLEAGHMSYRLKPVSARGAIHSTEEVLSPLAIAQHVKLQLGADETDLEVHADETKLQQILVNLVANGIKHSKPDGVVTLSCHAEGDAVVFDVADEGEGIPDDRLRDIFDPYVQLESADGRSTTGWGLGLAISRELSLGMSGTLTVRSELGRGSVFSLQLPRESAARASGASTRLPVS